MIRLPVPSWAGVACLFLTTILLSACGPGSGPPRCSPDVMPAAQIIRPGGVPNSTFFDTETRPEFQWIYEGACLPDDYRILISRVPAMPYGDFEYLDAVVVDVRTTGGLGATIVYAGGDTAHAFSWRPETALANGIYYWRVIPYSSDFHGEGSEWAGFRIGRRCASLDDYTIAPRLVHPRYSETIFGNSPHFMWLDDNTCAWGKYYVDISKFTYFPEGETLTSHPYDWTDYPYFYYLDYCTRYYWRVRVALMGIDYPGPVSEVSYFDTSGVGGAACPPASALPPTGIPTPSAPFARLLEPANCRSGPTTEYPVLDILVEGAELPIQGQNRAGDSWLVEDVNISHTCWVHGSMVEVIGDTSHVMIIDPTPPGIVLPTETPVAPYCSQFTNPNICIGNNHPCKWANNACVSK